MKRGHLIKNDFYLSSYGHNYLTNSKILIAYESFHLGIRAHF